MKASVAGQYKLPSMILLIGCIILTPNSLWLNQARSDKANSIAIKERPSASFFSFGHQEFASILIALQGLSSTVNAWSMASSPEANPELRERVNKKFDEFLTNLPFLAKESLGMREIFLFPASYLAFERNDIDRAIEVAQAGAKDPRLEVDLILSVAYLTHIFKGDFNSTAAAYERVLVHFPSSTWLKNVIAELRAGRDPLVRPGKDRTLACKMLNNAFPLARDRLIKRKICTEEIGNSKETQ